MNSSSSRRVLISAVLLALILPWMSVFAKGYGLIVGIDRYNPRYVSNNLGSCVHDAVGFRHQLLTDVSRWPVANCMMLTNSAATKTAIRAKLAALASTATSGDTVVYFQSSHGGTVNEGGTDTYLCTYNDDYEDSELASDLLAFKSGVKVIIVIDACYAAGLFKSDSTVSSTATRWTFARNVTDKMQSLRVKNVKLSKDASVGWLTACDYAQESWEFDPYGLFAGYVIAGFQKGDANADGKVTFLELFNYADPLARAASAEYGEEQDPQVLNTSLLGSTVARDLSVSNDLFSLSNAVDNTVLTWTTGGDADWFGQTDESYDGVGAARSGIVGSDSESWMQTTVTGPGTLSFKWKVSSDKGYDYLRFYCDNIQQGKGITGEQGWAVQQYTLSTGTHTLRWVYSKDEVINDGSDCGWVDQVVWFSTSTVTFNAEGGSVSPSAMTVNYGSTYGTLPTPVRSGYFFDGWWTSEDETGTQVKANTVVSTQESHILYAHWLSVVSLPTALDEPEWVWTTGGDTYWQGIQTVGYDGVDSARSGSLTNPASAWLQTTVTGPVTLSFWWKVSSSNGSDYLSFLIDGAEQSGKISGETDWAQKSVMLADGTHTVKWVYAKKTTTGQGNDCGWIDQVALDQGNLCFTQDVYTTSGEGASGEGEFNAVVPVWGVGPVSATVTAVPASATAADYSMATAGLNLTWEAGESGVKYVTVPIKGDALVEGNEQFYLILGSEMGGVIGEPDVCTVIIADDDAGSVADKGVYVSGVAIPPEGGSVTGGGYCPVGKTVKMTATAKTGWTFLGWENGAQSAARTVTGAAAVAAAQNGAWLCRASFKRTTAIAVPQTENPGSQSAMVGVAYRLALPIVSESLATVKVSGLPTGIKLDATSASLVGVPSKTGTSAVTFTASNVAGAGSSQTFTLTVTALPAYAQGTFNGEAGTEALGNGLATMSVTALGKVTGKVSVAGTNYSFSASSYSGLAEDGALLLTVTATVSKVTFPITLSVSAPELTGWTGTVPAALGRAKGTFGDGDAVLYRNVWKDTGMTTVAMNAAGYYTAVLPPDDDGYGSGYLLFTVNKAGGVKVTGKLADGTAVSLSGTRVLDEYERIWTVLYAAPTAYKGGVLFGLAEFASPEGGGAVFVRPLEGAAFVWTSRNPQATASYGACFERAPGLVGGWYNTTENLYAYYAGKTLTIGVGDGAGAPNLTVATNRYEAAWWSPEGLAVAVATNKSGVLTGLSASAAGTPSKTEDGWVYDATDNTVGLTLKLTRATGVMSGTFKAWFDYGTTHTSKTIAFQGALTPVREDINDDVEGRGYFLWANAATIPSTGKSYTVNSSYDFLLRSVLENP